MSDQNQLTTVEVVADHPKENVGLLSPDVTVLLSTWVVFFLLLAILYKFAWKPILSALEQREDSIRRSIEEAEKTHREYEKINETRAKIIKEAEDQAKEIVGQAKKTATNAAKIIEQTARDEAQIILENTKREISAEIEKVRAQLREESAEFAVSLAGKIISENLNTDKNRKFMDSLINKFS